MPERADVPDVAENVLLRRHFQRVGVEIAVMPLVADRQQLPGLARHARHPLAVADGLGHQLLAQDVLALLHRLDGDRRVQVQRQGDDHHLDIVAIEQLW